MTTCQCFPAVLFTSATHNILSKPPATFRSRDLLNILNSLERGKNHVAMTIMNPQKKFWASHVLKQRPPFLNTCTLLPRPGGSVVSMSDSWPGGCEFDPRMRGTSFLAYFCLSPLQKHVRKVVSCFWKKSCVSTGVRKPGNTCVSPTAMIWLELLKWR